MNIIPEEDREKDTIPLTKEELHEQNKKVEHDANAHGNQHPDHNGEGHNPTHHAANSR